MKKIIFYTIFCLAVFILIPQNTNAQTCVYGGMTCLASCISTFNSNCCCYNPLFTMCSGTEYTPCLGYANSNCTKPTCSSSGCITTAGTYVFDNGIITCTANGCRYYNGYTACTASGWGCARSGENCGTDGCVGSNYYDYYCSGGNCTYLINYNDSRCLTLTVNSTPITGISITGGPTTYSGTTLYTKTNISAATLIALTAPLTFGSYSFSNWSGCASSFNQTLSFLMPSSNTTCTANYTFTPPPGCNISGYNYANGICNGQCQYCDISKSTTSWSNVPSGMVCYNNSLVSVSSSAGYYCNYGENCDAGDCSATKWWTSCNGSGSCRAAGSSPPADSYTETVYANTGYTLTSSCGTSGTALCDYSGWNGCYGTCQRKRDQLRCNASHNCAYDVGDDYADCNPYTCSGSSCTSICSKACGAACENNADCPVNSTCQTNCTCSGVPVFDFSISVNPDSGSVVQGGSTSPSTVTVGLISGTAQSVSFYISGLPSGASPSFNPPSCSPPCNSSMVISTSATTTPTGTYTLLVFGTNGPLSHYYLYTLNVTEAGTAINPPLATTTSATNITQTSATLNGTLTNMGGATSCLVWFEWGATGTEGVSGSYGNKTTPVSMTATGSIPSVTISSLTSGQTYYFEVFAKNGGSW